MGLWAEHLLPRCVDRAMDNPHLARLRAMTARGLGGRVLEVGYGSGHNLAHLPEDVDEVLAVEPSALARRLAEPRQEKARARVTFAGLCGEQIDLPDACVDGALVTWTLCTIPEVSAALAEIRRVLRPGAALHFVEHGGSDHPATARWQRRLTPIQKLWAGGCHLDRDVRVLLADAGFRIERLHGVRVRGPRILSEMRLGRAVSTT